LNFVRRKNNIKKVRTLARKASSVLYGLARELGKTASTVNDIETVLSGDLKKITKHFVKKSTYREINRVTDRIIKKVLK
jgi:hypothetical protein